MNPPNEYINSILKRFPHKDWFAAGAYSVGGQTMLKLERLGFVEKRPPLLGISVSRTWDWRLTELGRLYK